jgi:hypothetical protein
LSLRNAGNLRRANGRKPSSNREFLADRISRAPVGSAEHNVAISFRPVKCERTQKLCFRLDFRVSLTMRPPVPPLGNGQRAPSAAMQSTR